MTTRVDNNIFSSVKVGDLITKLYTRPIISDFGATIKMDKPFGRLFFLSRTPLKKYDGTAPSANLSIQSGWGQNPDEAGKVSDYKFQVLSKTIEVKTQKVKTAWTLEAIQDYQHLFGNRSEDEISKILAGELTNEAILQMDLDFFVNVAKTEAKKSTIDFNSIKAKEKYDLMYYYLDLIHDNSMDMIARLHNKASVNVFVSPKIASVLMSHVNFKPQEKLNGQIDYENLFYVGRINNVRIFCDFYNIISNSVIGNANHGGMFIGVVDLENGINSSVVYCPYDVNIVNETDPNSGEQGIFIVYSYGSCLSPQHSSNTPMLKYIEFSNLNV